MNDEHAASITTTMHSIATMLAGFQPPAAYAGRPLATVSDWDGFVRLAKLHTLTPLLHGVARACGGLPQAPSGVQSELSTAYENTRSRAEWMMPALTELVDALSAARLRFVILKGFPLIDHLYGDRGLRTTFDIDFWLPDAADAQRAAEILDNQLGYEITPGDHSVPVHRHLAPRWRPAPLAPEGDYYNPRLPWTVEAHTALWETKWWGLTLGSLDGFWDRHTIRRVDGRDIPVPCDVDNLLYLSMHQMLHIMANTARLIHLYDIHVLASRLPVADWSTAWDRAEASGLQSFLTAAVSLSRSIFATPLDPEAALALDARLAQGPLAAWLTGKAPDEVLAQDHRTPGRGTRLRLAVLSTYFAKGGRAKAWAFMQPVLMVLFPPAWYIRSKYKLPAHTHSLLPLYYLRHIATGVAELSARELRKLMSRRHQSVSGIKHMRR